MEGSFLIQFRNADNISILRASEPIAWFLTSYPAFVLTVHQVPGPQRWALLPFNIIGPLLCYGSVGKLAASLDWLWAFTSLIYVFHVTSILYIDCWTLPKPASRWNLLVCYKVWINPRRHTLLSMPKASQSARIVFISRKIALFLALWASHIIVELAMLLAVNPRPRDFRPEARSYFHLTSDRGMILRAIYAFHWAYLTYIILTVANAFLAVLFVGILQFDEPDDWPPLYDSPFEAYSLRRFWGIFWHKIGSPSQAAWGRTVAREGLGMTAGSPTEKVFLAFWVFAISGGTHVAVNWATKATAPVEDLAGDMVFLMLNFLGGLLEVGVSRMLFAERRRHGENGAGNQWWTKIMGFLWVFTFFYCIVPPWQYPYLHADAKSRMPDFKIDVQIPRRAVQLG